MDKIVVPDWTPVVLRYGVIGLVAPPGLGKFLTYSDSVAFFTALSIPSPEIMVPVVGAVELGAVTLLLLDKARRLAAFALLPVMAVALWTAGDWQALGVLVALIALLGIERELLVVDGYSSQNQREGETG